MPQNNKTPELVGSLTLTDLLFAQVTQQGNQTWLMIPVQQNPALFLTTDKNTNKPKVSLDISIWRNDNPKFGNTHFIRASVGKKNGQNLSEEQRRAASMILGNARLPKGDGGAAAGAPAPQGPVPPQMGAPAYGGGYGQMPMQGGQPYYGAPQPPAYGGGNPYQPMQGAPIPPPAADDLP